VLQFRESPIARSTRHALCHLSSVPITCAGGDDGPADVSEVWDVQGSVEGEWRPGREPGWPNVLLQRVRERDGMHLQVTTAKRQQRCAPVLTGAQGQQPEQSRGRRAAVGRLETAQGGG